MAEKKEDQRTLEMRIAELENRLGVGTQQMEFTEQEVAAYNKIADALGVGVGAEPIYQLCRQQPCRIQSCRIQSCRVLSCRVNLCMACRNQPCRQISQCINGCFACYAGDYEADLGGGFGTLGYY